MSAKLPGPKLPEVSGHFKPNGDEALRSANICILAHGMGGDAEDWSFWVSVLKERFPTWHVRPLQSLKQAARFLGSGLDVLAELAAKEMVEAVTEARSELKDGELLTLHCIGHSMGGIIVRGALAKLVEQLGSKCPEMGHYLSLSSPQLGIQASWWAPSQAWRNLCWLSAFITPQLAQLAIQDGNRERPPYLVEISRLSGPHMKVMHRFRFRTCATLSSGDPLISFPSGLIDPAREARVTGTFWAKSHWHFEERSGFDTSSCFQTRVQGSKFDSPGPPGSKSESLYSRLWQCRNAVSALVEYAWHCVLGRPSGSGEKSPSNTDEETTTIGICESDFASGTYAFRHCPNSEGSGIANRSSESENVVKDLDFNNLSKAASNLCWRCSADLTCRFPEELFENLACLQWRRVPINAHVWAMPKNLHVFLIAKKSEQLAEEHRMSRHCIECLAEILAD